MSTRFYFISAADLIDILSKGRHPPSVQEHFSKFTDNIGGIRWEVDAETQAETGAALGMRSGEGEVVPFPDEFYCDGPVEEWLLDLMEQDITTTPRFYSDEHKNKIKNTTLERLIEINDFEAKRDHLILKEMIEPFKEAEITPEMLMVTKYHARRTCFPVLDKNS